MHVATSLATSHHVASSSKNYETNDVCNNGCINVPACIVSSTKVGKLNVANLQL